VGRPRYIGIDANLDEDAPVGHLIRQLIEE